MGNKRFVLQPVDERVTLSMSIMTTIHDLYRILAVKNDVKLSEYVCQVVRKFADRIINLSDTIEKKLGSRNKLHPASVTIPKDLQAFFTKYSKKLCIARSELLRIIMYLDLMEKIDEVIKVKQSDLQLAKMTFSNITIDQILQ